MLCICRVPIIRFKGISFERAFLTLSFYVLFLSVPKEKDTKKKGTRGRCPRDPFSLYRLAVLNRESGACLFERVRDSFAQRGESGEKRKGCKTLFLLYRLVSLNRKSGGCLLGVVRVSHNGGRRNLCRQNLGRVKFMLT